MVLHSERGGGGGDSAPEAPKVTPQETAANVLAAQQATNPQAAALEFGIQSEYIPQLAQLYSQARETALPGGQALGQNLMDVTMNQLMNPTGISAGEQQIQGDIRNRELDRFSQQERTRSNLGGGLYGGRSAAAESRGLGELTQQFEAQDYDRVRQQQQFAQQMALQQIAQYLGLPIQSLQYNSPAATGNTALQGGITQRGQDVNFQAQQQASQAALQSAMWGALGQTAGGAASGALTGGLSEGGIWNK